MNIHQVVVYDRATGVVTFCGTTYEPERLADDDREVLLGAAGQPGLDYVVGDQVLPRPPMLIQWDDMTLRGVPAGAIVSIEDATYTADGEDIELEFPLPGTYFVTVALLPYLDWVDQIEVQP
ncbi:hypothetical protein ACNFBT_26335 [Pseudomonas sp. NY15181]|uniref:hypothetical protein n=1 Tax=Pseudomonas sp. NY15181 TaxID=3400349 RepID=UPI003A878420